MKRYAKNLRAEEKEKVDVVGPFCESADFIAQDREVAVFESGELLAVMSAGAYGFSLSSITIRGPALRSIGKQDLVSGHPQARDLRKPDTAGGIIRGQVTNF